VPYHNWPKTGSLLLVGNQDIVSIAEDYAKKIVVNAEERSLKLWEAKTHPDFRLVSPALNASIINIDLIRDLNEWSLSKPQISAKKVAIIHPAETMNRQAANAFLKTLEEPIDNLLFLLVTDKPSFLPATIRSRCFWVRLRSTEKNRPDNTLLEAIRSDLLALQRQITDPISVAARWMKWDPIAVVNAWIFLLHEELKENLQSKNSHPEALWKSLDTLIAAKRALTEGAKPNLPLLLESLLIQWASPDLFS